MYVYDSVEFITFICINVSFYCFQSQKIGEAVYCSGWEGGVCNIRGVRSTIMFIIARANKPLVLTAGGMYNLSIASYASVSMVDIFI